MQRILFIFVIHQVEEYFFLITKCIISLKTFRDTRDKENLNNALDVMEVILETTIQ